MIALSNYIKQIKQTYLGNSTDSYGETVCIEYSQSRQSDEFSFVGKWLHASVCDSNRQGRREGQISNIRKIGYLNIFYKNYESKASIADHLKFSNTTNMLADLWFHHHHSMKHSPF